MDTKERVENALKATRALCIPDREVKPVLRQLWKVFDKKWELIEAEDYRALIDGYFESKENKGLEDENKGVMEDAVSKRPCKRLHLEEHEGRASTTMDSLNQSSSPKEKDDLSQTVSGRGCRESSASCFGSRRDRTVESSSQNAPRATNSTAERALYSPSTKKPTVEPGSYPLHRKSVPSNYHNKKLIKPRTEKIVNNFADFVEPVPVVHPNTACPESLQGSSTQNNFASCPESRYDASGSEDHTQYESSFLIASSTLGEVKILLNCNPAVGQPNVQIPDFNAVLKFLEDKYRRTHKIVGPEFSTMTLLKDLCERYLELAKASLDSTVGNNSSPEAGKVGNSLHGLLQSTRDFVIGNSDRVLKKKASSPFQFTNSRNLLKVQNGMSACDEKQIFHKLCDITKGAENVKISLVDEIGKEDLPKFTYMPHNVIYQNAYVQISLARIADADCCSSCSGDCVSSSIPCACAHETGGEFAYRQHGLLKEEFLRACVSMKRNPQSHHFVFCQDCPLERSKNEDLPERCKGHLIRKFIKECWRKCGCNMDCGNRVVQRGITCKLQVFFTHEGKGWGLRTLQDLPEGSFVCEYVGEILTNTELYERNIESSGSGSRKHTYPLTLDADWGSERILRDEEALCLDATFSGNVARFINHRCYDANLIDIPVEVETPDRHYYHLAFFTTRKVSALEELTWDYGIDFADHDHPIEAFQCCCGSAFCGDVKQKETSLHPEHK